MAAEMLTCVRQGLAAVLRFDQFGAYDGTDGWALMIRNLRDPDEQSMTETHEALHHDLQWSSGWGLLSSGARLLARTGFRRHTLDELFLEMVELARHTHETYATTFSATRDAVELAYAMLAGDPEYLGYLDRGLALVDVPDGVPWQFRSAATSSVLQVCMRPAVTLSLLQRGFRTLARADMAPERDSPDHRLAAFEQAGGPGSWQPVFDQLMAEYPDRGGDADHDHRSMSIESPEVDRLRRFEEEILMPRCYAHVCSVLDGVGLNSVGSRQQSLLATAFKSAITDVVAEFAARIDLVTERRPLFEEALEYHRQRIWLREPLPADVTRPEQTLRDTSWFRSNSGTGQSFVCGLWLDRLVAQEQFNLGSTEVPDSFAALTAVTHDNAGRPRIQLGLVPPGMTPTAAQRTLHGAPLLVLTTHHSLARHAEMLAVLQTIEPVFVLMDLPIARHVKQWIAGGVPVRMAVTDLDHLFAETQQRHPGLTLVVFTVTRNHPFRFLCIGANGGVRSLADQMRRRYPDEIAEDDALIEEHREAMRLAVEFVLQSWHVLQQGGSSTRTAR